MQIGGEYKPHTDCENEAKQRLNWRNMKEKIYKLFLALMVSLSLYSGPIAQNEIRKMLECLSKTETWQVQELEEEKESEEIRKKKHYF